MSTESKEETDLQIEIDKYGKEDSKDDKDIIGKINNQISTEEAKGVKADKQLIGLFEENKKKALLKLRDLTEEKEKKRATREAKDSSSTTNKAITTSIQADINEREKVAQAIAARKAKNIKTIEEIKIAIKNKTAELNAVIDNVEKGTFNYDLGCPGEFIDGLVNCATLLNFDNQLYQVTRNEKTDEIEVTNLTRLYDEKSKQRSALDKGTNLEQQRYDAISASLADKDIPINTTVQENQKPSIENKGGARSRHVKTQKKQKPLKKMSKKELIKMAKTMKMK